MKVFIIVSHVLLFAYKESCSITLADKKIDATLHDYSKEWNEARAICEGNGGKLWKEDSDERKRVTQSYLALWPSNEIWIGLHYPMNGTDAVFGWTDCLAQDLGVLDLWKSGEPSKPDSDRCVFLEKSTGLWKTKPCGNKLRFICENVVGECAFIPGVGIPVTSPDYTAVSVGALGVTDCQTKCLSQTYNFTNCWAMTYDDINGCLLYFTSDPFLFLTLDRSLQPLSSFHMKECYTRHLDETDDTTITAIGSNDPDSNCSTLSQPSTTTSTPSPTTTTSTSTTTTASTSTTSTSTSTSTTSTTSTSTTTTPTTTTSTTPTVTTSTSTRTPTSTTTSSTSTTTPISRTTSTSTLTSTSTTNTAAQTTSTATSTSGNATSGFNNSVCLCPCSNVSNATVELALDMQIELTRLKLERDVKTLSASVRKKTSAKDDRTSSKFVGLIAVAMLCAQIGFFVVPDAVAIAKFCYKKLSDSRAKVPNEQQGNTDVRI